MPIAVPQSIGAGGKIPPSSDDSPPSNQPPNAVNMLQRIQDTLLLYTYSERTEVAPDIAKTGIRFFYLVALNQCVKGCVLNRGIITAYAEIIHSSSECMLINFEGSRKFRSWNIP